MTVYSYSPILTEVQNACVQLNLPKPSGVYDSQDENAQIMGSFANMVGLMLNEENNWQQMVKTFTVMGDGVEAGFDVPDDFSRFRNDTGWSYAKRRPVIILNPQQWAAIKSWLSQSFFVNPACRLVDDQVLFMTPPMNGEKITFEYIDKNWVIDGDDPLILKSELVKNSDVPKHDSMLFTIALKLKWMQARGMPTAAVQEEFGARFAQLMSRNQMSQVLSLNGGTFTGYRYLDNFWNTPDTGVGR